MNEAVLNHDLAGNNGMNNDTPAQRLRGRQIRPIVRRVTLGVSVAWLGLVAGTGWWMSQRATNTWLSSLGASAEYETTTTARVIQRLFTEMVSVTNMVARQSQVVELATRYRTDPPGFAELTHKQRAAEFTRDPLVRRVGDYMNALAGDLRYGRIYMNNMSDDTVTASNWASPDSIVGMIYTGRIYLMDALRTGNGSSFGIARLLKMPSYFVSSRIDDANDKPLGSVTVKFDASDMALYLTGRHISLIINRQGRVITSSSEPFMLRNVAALLPPGSTVPSADGEESGDPLNVQAMDLHNHTGGWVIDGKPYLLRSQPLPNTQYQLLTLASLDDLAPMGQRHAWTAGLVAVVGLALLLLSSHVVGQMLIRRQDERYAANYDVLTGLPNRRAVVAQLDRLFAVAKQTQSWVMVAFIDLDGFKIINDTYGHEVGDKFLIEVGRRMSAALRASDMLGRFGGDEFVVIGLAAPAEADDPDATANALRSRLAPLLIGTYAFDECSFDYAGASFGIASADPSVSSVEDLLKKADRLMYADKQARRALHTA